MQRWRWIVFHALLWWSVVGPPGAQAQQAELTDAQKLVELSYKLNACDASERWLRNTMAAELRQVVEQRDTATDRAKKAEAALALAQEELKKRAPQAEKPAAKQE
jgi:hypothetical protein